MEQGLISDTESATLAGVSADTINRYGEFGLLKRVIANGKNFYKQADVEALFFINDKKLTSSDKVSTEPTADLRAVLPSMDPQQSNESEKSEIESLESKSVSGFENQDVDPLISPLNESISVEHDYNRNIGNSFELLELNSALREQIKTLRDERDWLRERLEKAEVRAEREQMLLLSESETIRRLVNQEPKKTSWFALPWFKN